MAEPIRPKIIPVIETVIIISAIIEKVYGVWSNDKWGLMIDDNAQPKVESVKPAINPAITPVEKLKYLHPKNPAKVYKNNETQANEVYSNSIIFDAKEAITSKITIVMTTFKK